MRFVQYTQTGTIRQRQFANRFTGSRFAVNASCYTGNLSLDGNASRKSICKTLGKYFASNFQGLLKTLSSQMTRLSQTRPILPEVDLQNT